MSHEKGILISFEGSEGCGKSTQIRRIADRLEDIDHREVVVTREPGGTLIGEDIRHLLMHAEEGEAMFPETELLLFAASRAQLVREVIFPAVEEGKIVLCDRFLDSTTVYQGVARQIAEDPVTQINNFAVGEIIPDLTIILDITPKWVWNAFGIECPTCPTGWNRKTSSSTARCAKVTSTWLAPSPNDSSLLTVCERQRASNSTFGMKCTPASLRKISSH